METKSIYCCQCEKKVDARLTDGAEIYPHRDDLHSLPFWKCDTCKNYVGCHHKTTNRTAPLGNIPNAALRNARQHIHSVLDPLWKSKGHSRKAIYEAMAERMGWKEYHTAHIRSIDEARKAYVFAKEISKELSA